MWFNTKDTVYSFRLSAPLGAMLLPALAGMFFSAMQPLALGQSTFDGPAGTTFIVGTSINSLGDVAGYYVDSNNASHGFIRDLTGNVTLFDPNPACTSNCFGGLQVWGINTSLTVVGDSYQAAGSTATKAFICHAPCSTVTKIDVPVTGVGVVEGKAINDNGVVTGDWINLVCPCFYHGYVRDASGKVTSFDAPNPSRTVLTTDTFSTAVNGNGELAGSYRDSAGVYRVFLRNTHGQFTTYNIPGNTYLWVTGVNNSDKIVGNYIDANGNIHGFTITNGSGKKSAPVIATISVSNAAKTWAMAINNLGAIAGYSSVGDPPPAQGFQVSSTGVLSPFMIPGSTTTVVNSINDTSHITGFFIDSQGVAHGFVQ